MKVRFKETSGWQTRAVDAEIETSSVIDDEAFATMVGRDRSPSGCLDQTIWYVDGRSLDSASMSEEECAIMRQLADIAFEATPQPVRVRRDTSFGHRYEHRYSKDDPKAIHRA